MSSVAESEQLTPFDRVTLARRVAAMRAETPPRTWARVAKAIGKSSATCRRLLKQLEQSGDPEAPGDSWAPIREHLATLDEGMAAAAKAMVDATPGSSAQVGAIRAYVDIAERRLELMQRVGWLPRQLGVLSAEREMQAMFRDFGKLLREHGASDELLEGLLALAQKRITRGADVVEGTAAAVAV
jgi:chorismate mutase